MWPLLGRESPVFSLAMLWVELIFKQWQICAVSWSLNNDKYAMWLICKQWRTCAVGDLALVLSQIYNYVIQFSYSLIKYQNMLLNEVITRQLILVNVKSWCDMGYLYLLLILRKMSETNVHVIVVCPDCL